jgi:iron-sulfur cluster repair protein YtfE (RIC family)
MGFWANLFGRGRAPRAPEPAAPAAAATATAATQPLLREPAPLYAKGTRIAYDNQLIEHLQADHRRLVTTFGAIRQTFVAGDTARAATLLDQFKSDIQEHLLTEEIKLYIYLQSALASDAVNHTLMRHMHHEMSLISQDVLNFLGKYAALGKISSLNAGFVADLDKVGAVLTERIRREETMLYPLYQSPSALEEMRGAPSD